MLSVALQVLLIRPVIESHDMRQLTAPFEPIRAILFLNNMSVYALKAANRSAYRNVLRAASFTFAGNIYVIFAIN
jgi:hypothetical protein